MKRLLQHRYLSQTILKSRVELQGFKENMNVPFTKFIMRDFLNPDRSNNVAFTDGSTNRSITFQDVHNLTYKFASALKFHLGLKANDCIAIMSPNHLHYFPCFHGISLLGGFSTTINPLYTVDEILHQINTTNAKAIVAHPLCFKNASVAAEKKGIPIISLDGTSPEDSDHVKHTKFQDFISSQNMSNIDVDSFLPSTQFFDSSSLIVVPFSSGTTGNPKGVMLTHRNLVSNALQTIHSERSGLELDPVSGRAGALLVPLPFFHIYGMQVGMCVPLSVGAKVVFMPSFDLKRFLELIGEHSINRALIVPPIALALAKHPLVDSFLPSLGSLEALMSGAAPLGADLQTQCSQRLNCIVKQGWGMTEISPVGTILPDHYPLLTGLWAGSSGVLMPGTEAMIVDPLSGEPKTPFEEGELLIRGPQVMRGYYQNEEATRNTIRSDGFMHTGDIGYFSRPIEKEGVEPLLFITDRSKELIKYKGFQVAPAELEAIVSSMKEVKDVVVIPVPDEEGGEVPRAYVVLQDLYNNNPDHPFSPKDVIAYVHGRVAPHKRLRGGVRFTTSIPKSPSGKLLRRIQIQIDRELDKQQK